MAGFGGGRKRHTVKRVRRQIRDINSALSEVFKSLNNAGFEIRRVEDLPDAVDDALDELKALRAGGTGMIETETIEDGAAGLPLGTSDKAIGLAAGPAFMGLGAPVAVAQSNASPGDEVVAEAPVLDPKAVQARLDARLKQIEEDGVKYRSFGPRGRTAVTREQELARVGQAPSSSIVQQVAAANRRIPR